MTERFQERNWDPTSREKETQQEEFLRYQGMRPAWRPAYYGYGASIAQELPFYGTEQYGAGQMFQQPYAPSIPQPFPGVLPQQFAQHLQQPFLHQQFPYGMPLQQPYFGMNLQQPIPMGIPQPIPQVPIQQPFGMGILGMGIPQHQALQQQVPPGIQQPFGQQLQQSFLPQSSPYAQIPQQQVAFGQTPQQPFGQQLREQLIGRFSEQIQQLQQLRGRFTGRGPKSYRRPDERIREDAIERLTTHPDIDATNVDISVKNGEITLKGTVDDRIQKRFVEDLVETVFGVIDVQNQLRVEQTPWGQFQPGSEREELTTKGKER